MKFSGLFILIIGFSVLAPAQDRSRQGRENPSPKAATTTRSQEPEKQDARDINRSKPREENKEKAGKRSRSKDEVPADEDARQKTADPDEWGAGRLQDPRKRAVQSDHQNVFETVRSGLTGGSVGSFSELLGPQVHISLRGSETGYFSSSQAYYVLERYMQENRITDLDYSVMEESAGTPFATGKTTISKKGMKETAQVYVSLSQVGGRWVISQIKIY